MGACEGHGGPQGLMGTCGRYRERPVEVMGAVGAHRALWKLCAPWGHPGVVGAHGDLWRLWGPVGTRGVHGAMWGLYTGTCEACGELQEL